MARGTNNGGHKGLSYTKFGYIFIAPFVIVYTIFSLYPLLTTFWYSVCNPKSNEADFWGFGNKDVFYDRYLDLTDRAIYPDQESFEKATNISMADYQLIRDYFKVQDNADDYLSEEYLGDIINIGTKDNGSGVTLSADTIKVLEQAKNDKSMLPLTESYIADPENNAYTDMFNWKDTYNDPQAFSEDNVGKIYNTLDAIVNADASEDTETEDNLNQSIIVMDDGFLDIIDALSDDSEFTPEQKAIVAKIAENIGVDDLKAYFEGVKSGDNTIDDASFYYAVRNLNTATSSFIWEDENGEMQKGVFEIKLTSAETYLQKNVWVSTITSLNTYSDFPAYSTREKSLYADKDAILADLTTLSNAGIITVETYKVEGDKITLVKPEGREGVEYTANFLQMIEKESDAVLGDGNAAIGQLKNYYDSVVFTDFSKDNAPASPVVEANNAGYKIEQYTTINGELDIDKYLEYKTAVGLKDALSYDNYVRMDNEMKAENKRQAEAIIATNYQDPAVREYGSAVDEELVDFDTNVFSFDVDKKGEGLDDRITVEGNTLQEQLDFLTPIYEDHLVKDADIINGPVKGDDGKRIEYRDGLKGCKGTDRFQIRSAYYDVYLRLLNAERQIKNPTGILSQVDSTKEYIFTGGENFRLVFTDKTTRDTVFGSFVSTGVLWIMGFIPQILLALLLSNWFTDNRLHLKGLNLMKALMYLPNVITAVTIAVFFRRIFNYSSGGSMSASQIVLRKLTGHGYNFFASPWASRWLVAFINFWMWYGNTMIVLIAGITSINESLFESAQIDGANSFQTYTKITLPLLRPILLYTFVSSLIGGLQMYDIPKNIINTSALINFNGTRIYSLRTVLMYVNEIAFGAGNNKQIGRASAVSLILFCVTTVLSILIFYMMRDKDAAKAAKAKKMARKAGK
ncbi:MAG: ABC transporter permease subunit [Saccharofermentans sp.]|nr:ABC transporter permease subunit [Saccharofermentans sp.]